MGVFLGGFDNKESVEENFQTKLSDDIEIMLATYNHESYEGSAYVLFKQNGMLFEVNADHCSCYGLEGQWEPSEVTKAELMHRLEKGTYFTFCNCKQELLEILNKE